MSFDMRAKPFDLDDNAVRWVNDTFNAMTQEEKIAQLFVDMLWNDTGKQTAALLGRYPSGGLRYNNASWLDERRMTYMAIQAPEGTKDLLPDEAAFWTQFKRTAAEVFGRYGYAPIETPVFEQTERFNASHLAEHELKSILNRYLFPYETWDKPCFCLSGGEKIRLLFCCLMIGNNAPDVFILDEPTNNLDIQSVEIITAAIKSYRGTVLLISHDHYFVKEIKINRSIKLFDTGSVI